LIRKSDAARMRLIIRREIYEGGWGDEYYLNESYRDKLKKKGIDVGGTPVLLCIGRNLTKKDISIINVLKKKPHKAILYLSKHYEGGIQRLAERILGGERIESLGGEVETYKSPEK